jgi:alkylation response protein AidB-like acyl-CoA dehydrogenase
MDPSPDPIPDWPDRSPAEDAALPPEVFARLADLDGPADAGATWPVELWEAARQAGATRWALPAAWGGLGCDRPTLLIRYGRLAEASLTAAFILTQHDAAVRRLAAAQGEGRPMADSWLKAVGEGRAFATVGISQLTTSRRHGERALAATPERQGGLRLDGVMPWVTGAVAADVIVTGAVQEDGQQLLVAVPAGRPGMTVQPPFRLAALEASCTSEVTCEAVRVTRAEVLAGPAHDVMAAPGLTGTGGLETSALALGQARAALVALAGETSRRDDVAEPLEALAHSWRTLADDLLDAAHGKLEAPPAPVLRARANALVLRATQAYLTARKGTGFLRTEPAQRWARQALFFLVWSCPTPIATAALRDLAGLCPA